MKLFSYDVNGMLSTPPLTPKGLEKISIGVNSIEKKLGAEINIEIVAVKSDNFFVSITNQISKAIISQKQGKDLQKVCGWAIQAANKKIKSPSKKRFIEQELLITEKRA